MKSRVLNVEKREKWISLLQEMQSDIDPQTVRLMDKMRRVAHALYQLGESSLASAGLSFARFRLLMSLLVSEELDGRQELNPSEISARQGISRNTVSTLIRDLEREGLIERHLDNDDRRRFNIRLTQAGRSLVRDNASQHYHIIAGCFDVLTSEEQENLNRVLTKLDASITETRESLDKR
ncbi:MAG: MarR family transcriptional regulator [Chloroflexi bacterium]|jgi:DNA-binding MarR family transcriptional regulator|nr:MarR family transcriptional regulator [Chloroflexota bacterium]